MCIVLLQGSIFCRYLSGPFDLCCHLVLGFLCWLFVWMTYLLVIEGFKFSNYHCVRVYIWLCMSLVYV
jgi:hypothetical protein